MTRLLVYSEGQTEESFVRDILTQHLYYHGYTQITAHLMGSDPQRNRLGGGVRPWLEARADILDHLRGDPSIFVTTMVDFYGMPDNGTKAWPGRAGAPAQLQFPNVIENSMLTDVCAQMGGNFNPQRFIPYVMMHEFEAMLFSDCKGFAYGIGRPNLASRFQGIRDKFNTPEDIDDSPETAPSKRIEVLVPKYRKPIQGVQAASAIGLPTIRAECPHFRGWLEHLEGLAN